MRADRPTGYDFDDGSSPVGHKLAARAPTCFVRTNVYATPSEGLDSGPVIVLPALEQKLAAVFNIKSLLAIVFFLKSALLLPYHKATTTTSIIIIIIIIVIEGGSHIGA